MPLDSKLGTNKMRSNNRSYVTKILEKSNPKLKMIFKDEKIRNDFIKSARTIRGSDTEKVVSEFINLYNISIKKSYQQQLQYDKKICNFLNKNKKKIKIVWGDTLNLLKKLPSESIHLMVTSPPYYNARSYANWNNLDDYLLEMKIIIQECYRVLDNNHVFVFNVGDIFDNDNLTIKSTWGKRRLPLGAYFIFSSLNIIFSFGLHFFQYFCYIRSIIRSHFICSQF